MVNSSGNDTNLDKSPTLAVTAAVSANQNAGSGFVDIEALPVQPGTFATSTLNWMDRFIILCNKMKLCGQLRLITVRRLHSYRR